MRPTNSSIQPGCSMIFLSCRFNLGGTVSNNHELASNENKFKIYNRDNIQTARRYKRSLKSLTAQSQFGQSYAIKVNSQMVSSVESEYQDTISNASSVASPNRNLTNRQNIINSSRTQKLTKRSLKHSSGGQALGQRQTHQRSIYRHEKQNNYLKGTQQVCSSEILNITDRNNYTDQFMYNYQNISNEYYKENNQPSKQYFMERRVQTEENRRDKKCLGKNQNVYGSEHINQVHQAYGNFQKPANKAYNVPFKPNTFSLIVPNVPGQTTRENQCQQSKQHQSKPQAQGFMPGSTNSTLPRNPVIKKQSLLQGKISGKTSVTETFLAPTTLLKTSGKQSLQMPKQKQCKIISPAPSSIIQSHRSSPATSKSAIPTAKPNIYTSQQPFHCAHPSDLSNTLLRKNSESFQQKFHTLADIATCKHVDSSGGEQTSSNHVSIVGSHNSINQSSPNSNVQELAKCIKLMTLKTMPLNQHLWDSWHHNHNQADKQQK